MATILSNTSRYTDEGIHQLITALVSSSRCPDEAVERWGTMQLWIKPGGTRQFGGVLWEVPFHSSGVRWDRWILYLGDALQLANFIKSLSWHSDEDRLTATDWVQSKLPNGLPLKPLSEQPSSEPRNDEQEKD